MNQDRRPDVGIPYADISWVKRKWVDISYLNESDSQKLDIYLPEKGEGPFPVIMSIHGGAFAFGDKQDVQITPHLKALERGYAVVGVNYRLSREAVFPAGIQDLKAALFFIKNNASKYKLDADKVLTWGGSAGAYYSVLLALTSQEDTFCSKNQKTGSLDMGIKGVVDWFGPMDFLKMDEQFALSGKGVCHHNNSNSPESRFLGRKITEVPELVKAASPLSYIKGSMPPILIQHGSHDEVVPVEQSIMLYDRVKQIAGEEKVKIEILEGAKHGGTAFETHKNLEKVFNFISSVFYC